jgi:hypothetical protein
MVRLMRQNFLPVLFFAAAANSDSEAESLAVSHRAALTRTQTRPATMVAQQTTFSNARIVEVDNIHVASSRNAINATTTSVSKKADTSHSVSSTAGADTVRTAASSREWISNILDTVVMALLGLASIVVAVILGRKQHRAMGVQLQFMLDLAHGRPRSNHVEMDDLERGQHNSNPDGSRIEARSEISSADPAAQQADLSNGFTGFPPAQPHVVGDDLPAQFVRDYEQASIQPGRSICGDDLPHNGLEPRGDEGRTLEDMPAASSCSHLDRQDSLDLDGPSASHPDDRESQLLVISGMNIH